MHACSVFMLHARIKRADQPVHLGILISAFVVRFLEGILTPLGSCKNSITGIYLVSVA